MRVTRALGCLFAVLIVAAGTGSGAQDDEVPLYTNADLEKFGPPSTPAPPAPPPPSTGSVDPQWDFVREHLDREYSRIAIDRRLDIDESLAEPAPEPEGADVGYPYYGRLGLWGYGYGGHWRRGNNNRVRDAFYLYYDQRTARHGYLVPRKNSPPIAQPYPVDRVGYGGHDKAYKGHGNRRGRATQATVRSGGSSRSGKVAASRGSGRSTSRSSVSRGSGRSSAPSRGASRGGSRGARSGGRGSRR